MRWTPHRSCRARNDLLHELARHVQQAPNTTRASATASAATRLALEVELERHLRSLRNSVLLRRTRVLHKVSKSPISWTR
jgi:hypothetical protein